MSALGDAYDKYRMDVMLSSVSGVPGNNKTYAMSAIIYLFAAIWRNFRQRYHFMRWRVTPLFRRLEFISTPQFTVALSFIDEPDVQTFLHNHRWTFRSLILRGGYTEEVAEAPGLETAKNSHRRWSVHRMDVDHGHRIIDCEPGTVTLLVCGRKVRRQLEVWTDQGVMTLGEYIATMYEGPTP